MPSGEIQLVAYGDENIVLSHEPQITFFKIIYRRYTNFSIETVRTDFLNQSQNFGKKYSVELSKLGDLIHKMWLLIDLPDIPISFNNFQNYDNKLKFKWAKKVAYALIDYVEIDIGGQIIDKQWGEWMNVLNELNWNNFNGSLDQYIGNTPEFTTYEYVKNGIKSKSLYIPLFFWFCNNSGLALPLLCLEYSIVRFYISLNNFQNCAIYSPDSFIELSNYYGQGILGEPLIQYSSQGVAWGEFDSLDVNTYNDNYVPTSYNLYFRKISDNLFITTVDNYYTQYNLNLLLNLKSKLNYFIYGLKSNSIFVPIGSGTNNTNSINIVKSYNLYIPTLSLKSMYLLIDYIYVDREERSKFFNNKHDYIIEQVYYSNPIYVNNLNNKNYIEIINPCKFIIFMAQVQYFLNPNVNELFNYNIYFFDPNKTSYSNIFKQKSIIKNVTININSTSVSNLIDMNYYNLFSPFSCYPKSKIPSGFGLLTFSLYPDDLQPSGSLNMSSINKLDFNSIFYPIDIDYNLYVFKTYSVTYNYLRIADGIAATIFTNNF